jgi:tetrahydromethanopterin S-methyltransferase subunit B
MDDIDKINPKAGVVDENLADVLLVSRNEIETYIAEMKKLHNDLQDLD